MNPNCHYGDHDLVRGICLHCGYRARDERGRFVSITALSTYRSTEAPQ